MRGADATRGHTFEAKSRERKGTGLERNEAARHSGDAITARDPSHVSACLARNEPDTIIGVDRVEARVGQRDVRGEAELPLHLDLVTFVGLRRVTDTQRVVDARHSEAEGPREGEGMVIHHTCTTKGI